MTRPNVVLILADQHRWDFIGQADNGVTHTPALDRLAERGTLFDSAYCTAPLCCPSRAAIASGRYGMNTGCFTNLHQLSPGTPSFVEQLRSNGYQTCVIGKTHMEIHAYDADFTSPAHVAFMRSLGWDEVIEADGMAAYGIRCHYGDFLESRGLMDEYLEFKHQWGYFMDPTHRGDPSFSSHDWTLPDDAHHTSFVGDTALAWLKRRDASRPFMLQMGFTAPHSPIAPTRSHMDRYREAPESSPWNNPNPPAWLADGRRGYRAMISHVDEYVGRLQDALAEQGLLENTVVIYTADHGEMAGDRGAFGKTTFFEGSVRVPLLMAGPGIRYGQRSDALVETIDIGRTVCDLVGVPTHDLDQGRSLIPVLHGEAAAHRDTVYSEMGCDRMLRDDRYKLMWGEPTFDRRKLGRLHLDKPVDVPPSPGALYDLHEDPHETNNLIDDPEHRTARSEMVERLLTRLNENTQTQPFLSRGEYRPRKPSS